MYIEAKDLMAGREEEKGKEKMGSGSVKITGSVGDVMKESISIAQMYTKLFLASNFADNAVLQAFESLDVHVHIPEGAVHKVRL